MRNLKVGLAVLFFSSTAFVASHAITCNVDRPMTATVAHVINDNMVNLSVLDHNGVPFSVTSVPIYAEGDTTIPQLQGGNFYATWQPGEDNKAPEGGVTERQYLRVDLARCLMKQGSLPYEIEKDLRSVEKAIFGDDVKPVQSHTAIPKTDVVEKATLTFTFSEALHSLKAGHKVARIGWNGKDQYVVAQARAVTTDASKIWNQHNKAHAEKLGGSIDVAPYCTLKTAQDTLVMGWTPSTGDLFANDWIILEETQG